MHVCGSLCVGEEDSQAFCADGSQADEGSLPGVEGRRAQAQAKRRRNPSDQSSAGSSKSEGSDDARSVLSGGARHRRGGRAHKKKRSFRLQCKQFALTYPQCPVARATFDAAFKLKHSPAEFASAREEHQDGSYHLHLFVSYGKCKDVRSARAFDVAVDGVTYHCNIQKCKNRAAWLKYISKGDDHGVFDIDVGFDPLSAPLGKRKSYWTDHQWSLQFAATRRLTAPNYPIKLVCADRTHELLRPDPAVKRRSWWIVAPPNAGKTRWLNKTFAGVAIYSPRVGPYPFEGYSDQDIVVYDDRTGVSFQEFASVLNTWDIITPVAGQVRYCVQNWKLGHTRTVIVLSNKTIEESMPEEDHLRMRKRFLQIINPTLIPEDEKSSEDEEEKESESAVQLYQEFAS